MIRIVITCNDRIERITKWVKTKEKAEQLAFYDILDWELPITLIVRVEKKDKNVEFTTCPHCNNGDLKPSEKLGRGFDDYSYDCRKCGRGWSIDKTTKMWRVLFATGVSDYTFKEVFDAQKHKEIACYILKINRFMEESAE